MDGMKETDNQTFFYEVKYYLDISDHIFKNIHDFSNQDNPDYHNIVQFTNNLNIFIDEEIRYIKSQYAIYGKEFNKIILYGKEELIRTVDTLKFQLDEIDESKKNNGEKRNILYYSSKEVFDKLSDLVEKFKNEYLEFINTYCTDNENILETDLQPIETQAPTSTTKVTHYMTLIEELGILDHLRSKYSIETDKHLARVIYVIGNYDSIIQDENERDGRLDTIRANIRDLRNTKERDKKVATPQAKKKVKEILTNLELLNEKHN